MEKLPRSAIDTCLSCPHLLLVLYTARDGSAHLIVHLCAIDRPKRKEEERREVEGGGHVANSSSAPCCANATPLE